VGNSLLISKNKSGMVVYACNPSYAGREGRRIAVGRPALGKTTRTYLKNN
jgi:hypothetical protein